MNDECSHRLITALRLLEEWMNPDTREEEYTDWMVSVVHDLVQRAWFLHHGWEPLRPLSEDTQVLLSTLAARDAINDAMESKQ